MEMKVGKIAVIGAGNGGITAAADLTNRGFSVSLYESHAFSENLEGIRQRRGIVLQDGNGEKFIDFTDVTTDIEEAVRDAEIIMLTVPSFAIENIAGQLAPVVEEGQVILLNGAGSMGSVRFVNRAKEMGIEKSFDIAETNSLTYGTRAFPDEARVEVSLYVKRIFLAAYPSSRTGHILEICSELYDCFIPAESVWHTALENGNPEVHPGPALLNAGRIDYSKGEFWLYKEGITEHTVRLLRAVEQERMAIGSALGYNLEDAAQSRAGRGYFKDDGRSLQELFNTSPVYTKIKGPVSIDSRYFTEDISNGLVLWSDLGKLAGVETPNIDAVITLGGTLLAQDFRQTGLTLDKLGFSGMTPEEILESV